MYVCTSPAVQVWMHSWGQPIRRGPAAEKAYGGERGPQNPVGQEWRLPIKQIHNICTTYRTGALYAHTHTSQLAMRRDTPRTGGS